MKINFDYFQIQEWMLHAARAEQVDKKNGVVCLVSMFLSWVMVLKFYKKWIFCNFVLTLARNLSLLKLASECWSILVYKIPPFLAKSYRIKHHTFLESRHHEVIKNLYYVLSTQRCQIPFFRHQLMNYLTGRRIWVFSGLVLVQGQ